MRSLAIPVLLALLVALPQATAHQTVTDTTYTGKQDVWGLPNTGALTPQQCAYDAEKLSFTGPCIATTCTADIYIFYVTLELVDPSPGDAVALSVVGDMWYLGDVLYTNLNWQAGSAPTGAVQAYPTEVATYDDPVAEIPVQLGGCNRDTMAVVSGIHVDGSVTYRLTF